MIISVEEAKKYIDTDMQDAVLESKLQALELLIRRYTNNNFQDRRYRTIGDSYGKTIEVRDASLFSIGDTVMVDSDLCVIEEINENVIKTNEMLFVADHCIVTKIVYPMDVKMGVVNMLKWDIENREKVCVQSETISRHSVTYFNMDGDNSTIGYPKILVGFLKPYMKARF